MGNEDIQILVERGREAQRWIEYVPQDQVDKIVAAVGWQCYAEPNVRFLSAMAFEETGLGNPQDLYELHRRRVLGTLADLYRTKTTGIICDDREAGLQVLAKPVGLIAVASPATAPCSGVSCNALQGIKTRNALIFSPNPAAWESAQYTVELMRRELARIGVPPDLVQCLHEPDRKAVERLMSHADMVIAVGGRNTVRRAHLSGSPAIAAGVGNPTVIVDETADLASAVEFIVDGGGYNNGTSCSSESNVLVQADIYQDFLNEAASQFGHVCSPEEGVSLRRSLIKDGRLNRNLIGLSAPSLASAVGIDLICPESVSAILVPYLDKRDDDPFLGEKLTPVIAILPYRNFDEAIRVSESILEQSGKGHSCGIHTNNEEHVNRLANRIKTCRVMVNQSTLGNSGNFDNGLPFTSTVSGGSWGGSGVSGNVTWRHMLNYTYVSRRLPRTIPSPETIFGTYWRDEFCCPREMSLMRTPIA